jgi:ApaG protein
MNQGNNHNIVVEVQATYEPKHSNPDISKYVYSYIVRIENRGENTVQLLGRHWVITDATMTVKEVKGEGVIGQQPVLKPNESHTYTSWCPLITPFGKMGGSYIMKDLKLNRIFKAEIPEFKLIADYIQN